MKTTHRVEAYVCMSNKGEIGMKFIRSALFGISIAAAAAVASQTAAEEAVLRGVSCFPIGSPPSLPFEAVVEEINKRGTGVVKIDLLGGAPAIGSPFQVAERMALGAFDIAGCPESFFGNLVPEADALRLQELPFAELRKNGAIDYLQELMKAKGAYFIGRHASDGQFHLFLSKPIDKPDLTGLNVRVSPAYTSFMKAMGATVQRSSMSEVYTLMENHSVDGYGWSLLGFSPSWYPVTKYRVDPGFYNASIHTIANLKKWESLSDEARAVISGVVLEAEAKVEIGSDYNVTATREMLKAQAEKGIETIKFEGADAEKWLSVAKDSAWSEFLEQNPEHGAKLKALFTKAE